MKQNKLWLLLLISGVIFSSAVCLSKEKIPTAEEFFVGSWQGHLSGSSTDANLLGMGWKTNFEMEVHSLEVGKRQDVSGRAIFSRQISGLATINYVTPRYIGVGRGIAKLEKQSVTGSLEGWIDTDAWGVPGGESGWSMDLSYETLKPGGSFQIYDDDGDLSYQDLIRGGIVGVYTALNAGHFIDLTIDEEGNSITLQEKGEFRFPGPEHILLMKYEIDGVLYKVHYEPFNFKDIPPNGLVKTDEHTRKEIIIPNVGEIIVNTDSECKFKTERLLEQFKGELFYKIRKLEPHQFEIRTPVAAIGVRGTQFVTNVDKDGTTTLTVLEGSVEFSDLNKKKTVVVKKNQTSVVKPGGLPSEPAHINPGQIPRWWE
ncbi:MAG: FecR family protein [Candidatus Aerophobetes bacterium]|nr:FecR family protein [Candidatus Aerophobetes bacterium]